MLGDNMAKKKVMITLCEKCGKMKEKSLGVLQSCECPTEPSWMKESMSEPIYIDRETNLSYRKVAAFVEVSVVMGEVDFEDGKYTLKKTGAGLKFTKVAVPAKRKKHGTKR